MTPHRWLAAHGWLTLLYKELLRFWKVSFQTIAAPMLTALLYLLIFSHVLEGARRRCSTGRCATRRSCPGPRDDVGAAELVRQHVVVADPVEDHRQPDLRAAAAAVAARALRAPTCWARWCAASSSASACSSSRCGSCPSLLAMPHPFWALAFALLGSAILGTLGLIAGIWADKFDQLAAFQNFIIVPLTFLSGVFYSIHSLPPFWQALSHFNPFFYMIDGFRYGFFGLSDVAAGAEPRDRRGGGAGAVAADRSRCCRAAGSCATRNARPWPLPNRSKHRSSPGSIAAHVEVAGDGQHFEARDRLARVRGTVADHAPPARLRGARRPHARGDPRAVDDDADAGRVGARGNERSTMTACAGAVDRAAGACAVAGSARRRRKHRRAYDCSGFRQSHRCQAATLDFTRAPRRVTTTAYRGASAYAIGKGFSEHRRRGQLRSSSSRS